MKIAGLQGLTGSHRDRSVRVPQFLFALFLLCSWSLRVIAQQKITRGALQGKLIFSANCAACHGLDGQGGERGPNIATRREIQRKTDQGLAQIVHEGVPGTGMPAFRSLSATAIQSVVQHLRELQGHKNNEPLIGNSKVGRTLFFGKAECSRCHIMNGEGGFIAADLSNYANGHSAAEVRDVITAPDKNLDPRKAAVVVTTAEGDIYRGVVRNEDNFSLQMQTVDGAFHLFSKAEVRSIEHESQSLMPNDYAIRLTRKEIDDLVSYLFTAGHNYKLQRHAEDEE
jgi:cytochrome c oxidase cbb3-type subunit 3